MKIALGIVVTDELYFLKRHLPKLISQFDGVFVCDGGSTDGSFEYLQTLNINLTQQDYGHWETWNESEHKNHVIKEAERAGFDWILNLDADEMMTREGIKEAKSFMNDNNSFLAFPRIEFYGDTNHFRPTTFPDIQGRAWKLNCGYYWQFSIHSLVFQGQNTHPAKESSDCVVVPNSSIFHYGWALAREKRYARYYGDTPVPDYLNDSTIKVYSGKQPVK